METSDARKRRQEREAVEHGAPRFGPVMGPLRKGESRYRDLPILKRCLDCGAPLEWFEAMTLVREGRPVTPLCLPCARVIPPGDLA